MVTFKENIKPRSEQRPRKFSSQRGEKDGQGKGVAVTKNDGKDDERETETRRGTQRRREGKQSPGEAPRDGTRGKQRPGEAP